MLSSSLHYSRISLVDMQQQQQQPPTSKLVLAVSHLPFADYQRFVMHDIPAAIRLSRTCRVLYKKLRDHSSLWQHLYHDKFLSGLCAAKEWDFVCWYARTRLPIDDTSVGTTTSLDRLDWYEIYCHRVITEQNWRYNRSRRITIPWPTSEYQCDWELLETTLTTTVLATPVVTHDDINKRRSLGLNERRFLGLNERVYFPNDENTTTPIWFELSKCGLYKGISSLLGYEFAIIVIEGEESTVIDIYDRRHYRLQRTISLPPTFSNQSFVGNWIIFPTKKDYSKQQNSFPLFVYNIAKDIQFQKDYPMYINSACIYEATSDYAIIYTARLFEDRGRTGEWTLHQFHVDGTDKLLHKEQLNLPWVDYDLRVSYH
ncbi:hypothetical protein BDF22DRAFT_699761 [Syncephalis plumigaleata]|nr:hypothetical protein BDF22DRAFT_699761 [Syncephalis plumigaleata]